jgi:cobalt-zinc-cadmium resistance protein CzcA
VKVQNGAPIRVRDLGAVTQAPKVRLGELGKTIHREDGVVINDDDVVEGIVLLRKGAEADATLDALHEKIEKLNHGILPPGVKLVPHLDRSDLVHYTTHTVLRNLTDGVLLVTLILFLFLGNVRSALIVTFTIPFSLLFAAILLDLSHIPANLLSLGALDFGMVVDGSVVMVENILRHAETGSSKKPFLQMIATAAHEVQRPVFFASSLFRIFRFSPCNGWKADCSALWRGQWHSPFWARYCLPCSLRPCCAACFSKAASRNGKTPCCAGFRKVTAAPSIGVSST